MLPARVQTLALLNLVSEHIVLKLAEIIALLTLQYSKQTTLLFWRLGVLEEQELGFWF